MPILFWNFYDSLPHEARFIVRITFKTRLGVTKSTFYSWKNRLYIPAKYKEQVKSIISELFPDYADNIEYPTDWKTFKKNKKDLHGADWKPSPASGREKGPGKEGDMPSFIPEIKFQKKI
jgi:hypothetical protein